MVSIHSEEDALNLPATEEADDSIGVDHDIPFELAALADGDDPFDDAYADDLPLDLSLSLHQEHGTAIGDDSTGLEEASPEDGVGFDDTGDSLLDDGRPDDALGLEGDDDHGIDAPPGDEDDGGIEGIEDPVGERINELAFPPIDGAEDDDDEELELDIRLDD
jgi:hypothetical protein